VGNIEKVSASVLVDGEWKNVKGADGKEKKTYVERTPQEIEKFRALIASAIGLDKKRADELTVISFPFAQDEALTAAKPEALPWVKIIEKVLLGVSIIGLFLLLRSLIQRMTKSVPALPAVAGAGGGELPAGQAQFLLAASQSVPTTPEALAAGAAQNAALVRGAVAQQADAAQGGTRVILRQNQQTVVLDDTSPSVETLKHQELLKRTTDYIVQKPDSATQILRGWILDESPEKLAR
jgi:flagellar M-ring protein FliF